jgi:co-chaperonin GroES (HSP10)
MTGTNGQAISNNSGIQPLEYNVLVLPKDVERKTKGGLLLAEQTVEKEEFGRTEGILVAVSPMAFTFADWPADAPKPRLGQRVMFSKYQGVSVQGRDGKAYWIIKDKSLMAVIEDSE